MPRKPKPPHPADVWGDQWSAKQLIYLQTLSETCRHKVAADAAGVSPVTAWRWRNEEGPGSCSGFKAAHALAERMGVENVLIDRAIEISSIKGREFSERTLWRLIQAHAPEIYADIKKVEFSGAVDVRKRIILVDEAEEEDPSAEDTT